MKYDTAYIKSQLLDSFFKIGKTLSFNFLPYQRNTLVINNMYLHWLLFCGTSVYAVIRIADQDLAAINFAKALHGRKLNGSVFQEISVDSEDSCEIACVKEARCLSYNFGIITDGDTLTCQLSDSDRFASHENLAEDGKVLYRGIQVNFL